MDESLAVSAKQLIRSSFGIDVGIDVPGAIYLVLNELAEVIGFASFNSKTQMIQNVCVSSVHRRCGWMSRLLTSILEECNSPVFLEVEDESGAYQGYQKLGFVPVSSKDSIVTMVWN